MSYTKTNWENLPSTNTPVNATNLNKIENELEKLDDAIIEKDSELITTFTLTDNTEQTFTPSDLTKYSKICFVMRSGSSGSYSQSASGFIELKGNGKPINKGINLYIFATASYSTSVFCWILDNGIIHIQMPYINGWTSRYVEVFGIKR